MKKAAFEFAINFVLASAFVIGYCSILAEIERREAAELRAMEKARRDQAKATKWSELDAAGRRMTGYDQIVKK